MTNPTITERGPEDATTSGPAAEQARREEELVQRVLDSFAQTPDARLHELMDSLVRHLHSFIRDVRLTEGEWDAAIQFLTAVGHITDDRRQEFVLLSDVLGASMQVIGVNNPADGEATESTVFGPFFVEDAPEIRNGEDISGGAADSPVGSRAPCGTLVASRSPMPGSRCGRRTRTASTMSSMTTSVWPGGHSSVRCGRGLRVLGVDAHPVPHST